MCLLQASKHILGMLSESSLSLGKKQICFNSVSASGVISKIPSYPLTLTVVHLLLKKGCN